MNLFVCDLCSPNTQKPGIEITALCHKMSVFPHSKFTVHLQPLDLMLGLCSATLLEARSGLILLLLSWVTKHCIVPGS